MKLYEIIIPEDKQGANKKNFKEFISFMEKFYTSMFAISHDKNNKDENYYALEIAKPNSSNEIALYISVLKDVSDLLRRVFLLLFPDIIVKHSLEDYNVFSERGFQLAAYASGVKLQLFHFAHSEKMENDPISLIMSAFTKLKKEGEGASLQIIVKPAEKNF